MLKCNLLIRNLSRQFQISMGRLSKDVFHVQDEDDFQKHIIDSRKLFLVGFHASW
jgi:hypothetical protein